MLEARVSVIGSGSFRLVKLSNSTFHINLYSSHTVQVAYIGCTKCSGVATHCMAALVHCDVCVCLQHIAQQYLFTVMCGGVATHCMAALAHCDVWVCLHYIVQQHLHSSICQL